MPSLSQSERILLRYIVRFVQGFGKSYAICAYDPRIECLVKACYSTTSSVLSSFRSVFRTSIITIVINCGSCRCHFNSTLNMLVYQSIAILLVVVWLQLPLPSEQVHIEDNLTDLHSQLKFLAQQLQSCQGNTPSNVFDMKLHLLDKNTTCNDGSPAGYYLKRAPGSKRWLVYLEGGWFCVNRKSCKQRANSHMRTLMTSLTWPSRKRGSGMMSPDPEENPSWWNANQVLVPYCSSDAWSGNVSSSESGETFSFLGARIIERVIEDLLPKGLYHSKQLLLAGSSAGSIGVMLNIDRISHKLRSLGSNIEVRGLADSGWYLSDGPSNPGCPKGATNCGPSKTIKEGMKYWRGIVPDACAKRHQSEPWKCYFGNIVYPTLKTSLFVFQWLYDEAQLALDGSGRPRSLQSVTAEQVNYILTLGKHLRKSLRQSHVHSVFSPACISHTILTHNNWLKVRIAGHTLNDALNCWLQSSGHNRGHGKNNSAPQNHLNSRCKKHLLDTCFFPHCNPTCPLPRDPHTGKPYVIKMSGRMPGVPLNPNDNSQMTAPEKYTEES